MEATLRSASLALLTSAATVIAGLSLMGVTKFKLFSSTGPSVARAAPDLGGGLDVDPGAARAPGAVPAEVVRGAEPAFGHVLGSARPPVLRRPLVTWLATLLLMVPPAVSACGTVYIQDTLTEMPPGTPSVQALQKITAKFGRGFLAPLTIVLEADAPDVNLKNSEGLALIDDVSRFLSKNRRLVEVRSATQPLGSTALLDPARIYARLSAVDKGFDRMAEGAGQLHDGLTQGVAKIRLAMMLESAIKDRFGQPQSHPNAPPPPQPEPASPPEAAATSTANRLLSSVAGTATKLDTVKDRVDEAGTHAEASAAKPAAAGTESDPARPWSTS